MPRPLTWPRAGTDACLAHLRGGGAVVIPVSRLTLIIGLAGCTIAALLCGSLVGYALFGDGTGGVNVAAFGNVRLWVCFAGVLFFGVFGIPTLAWRMVRGERMVLTPTGLTVEAPLRRASAVQVPWHDITRIRTHRLGTQGRGPRELAIDHGRGADARTEIVSRPFAGRLDGRLGLLQAAHAQALAAPTRGARREG